MTKETEISDSQDCSQLICDKLSELEILVATTTKASKGEFAVRVFTHAILYIRDSFPDSENVDKFICQIVFEVLKPDLEETE